MDKITITLPAFDEVDFNFTALKEYEDVKGNASAVNEEVYKKIEREILKRLNDGDISAWFCARMIASFRGIEAAYYLGCCSYASFDDFFKSESYEDMKKSAYESLLEVIRSYSD